MAERRETPRDRARTQTLLDITRIGREHLARDGAAALSLRAVARDLGVVSSAVYRYVASRDDLLTLLVVDAFTELADSVDLAVSQAGSSPRSRVDALASSMRGWAVREPARWSLLYGSPVPGYQAPAEQTTGPGIRVMAAFVAIVDDAYATGRVTDPSSTRLGRVLRADLRSMATEVSATVPEPVLARGVLWWSALVGVISSEVFGQFGAETFSDPDALFTHHLAALDETLGITA